MILTVDIGNSNICFSAHRENSPEPLFLERIHTDHTRTAVEFSIDIRTIMKLHALESDDITGCVLSSVVPSATRPLTEALEQLLNVHVLHVSCDLDLGFTVDTKNPYEVGTDILADAAGALLSVQGPVINIDMGTATVLSMIDAERKLRGVLICPGVRTSLNALFRNTSALTDITLLPPAHSIGTNTADAMRSGIIYGTAGMLDRLISEMEADTGTACTVFLTGGNSPIIAPYVRHSVALDRNLLMKGLFSIYQKNH